MRNDSRLLKGAQFLIFKLLYIIKWTSQRGKQCLWGLPEPEITCLELKILKILRVELPSNLNFHIYARVTDLRSSINLSNLIQPQAKEYLWTTTQK